MEKATIFAIVSAVTQWCICITTHANLEARLLLSKARAMYKVCLITALTVIQLLFHSGHTVLQKNAFICFPGESHHGLNLFNKVSPYKLQKAPLGGGVPALPLLISVQLSVIYNSE